MYHNIPLDLQHCRQWVCWRYEQLPDGRITKVPYAPNGVTRASVTDPSTWGDFATACEASLAPNLNGIGFVLTKADPFAIIDLDNKVEKPIGPDEWKVHERILTDFATYTERSVSGRGYHIVLRGKLEAGRRRGNVEVYSSERYMCFTGDVVRNAPIAEYQVLLEGLVAEMPTASAGVELTEYEDTLTDFDLHEMAVRAANGDKYDELCKGDWQGMGYTSQSEADLALLSILAYYSKSNEQVRRVFRYSNLGKREKAICDNVYIDRTLRKIRANQPDPADYEAARLMAERLVANMAPQPELVDDATFSTVEAAHQYAHAALQAPPAPSATPAAPAPPPPARAQGTGYSWPPGLLGEMAAFFHATALRPLPETAITAAIALAAGVAGRSYNISGTGLNQYLLFIGKTGVGKESMAKGISKLFRSIRNTVPLAETFVGPSAFASGQGLIRTLDQNPCFVSIMGEFGLTLQALSDPRAPAAQVILRKVLLDLYGKSGWEDFLRPTAYSDSEKNTKLIHAPTVTLLGESTPETFYDGLSATDIADGLVPRFHIVEYKGERPMKNPMAGCAPEPGLVQRFGDLCSVALTTQSNHTCANVQIAPDALVILDEFDLLCDEHMRGSHSAGETQLWNRAHLKALKLAGLLAVGVNPHAPTVTTELARWAIDFTVHGTQQVLARFFEGDVGQGEAKQMSELRHAIRWYLSATAKDLGNYKVKKEVAKAGMIPYSFFVTRLSKVSAFYHDRLGAARAIKNLLENMVASEMLGQLTPLEAKEKFGLRQAVFYLGASW